MRPPPRSFLDPVVIGALTPLRAYNAITDGIEGTEMKASEALSTSDRWNLAFYVFTLRHGEDAIQRGAAAFERSASDIVPSPTRLAGASDEELLSALAALPQSEAMQALAYLRSSATFATTGAPLDRSRELLAATVLAYAAGDRNEALQQAASAYLDGFEPHEASLAARDDQLLERLEHDFLTLRGDIGAGASVEQVEQRSLRIAALLDAADEALSDEGGAGVAFVSSLTILLREGLEGALLVLLLLGVARRSGAGEADSRAIHWGWLGAIGGGVITWFLSGWLIEVIGGARRELIEGVVSLLAAFVLLGVSHFVLARVDAQRRVAALKEKLQRAASSPRRKLVLASLAFVAVYREAFEVVLFLQAIMLDSRSSGLAVGAGALAGIGLLIIVMFAVTKLGKRLPAGPLLTGLGTLLCVLAVSLAGKGVRALQEAGVIEISAIGAPKVSWIGVYPTTQTMLAQLAVLVIFVGLAAWALRRSRTAAGLVG